MPWHRSRPTRLDAISGYQLWVWTNSLLKFSICPDSAKRSSLPPSYHATAWCSLASAFHAAFVAAAFLDVGLGGFASSLGPGNDRRMMRLKTLLSWRRKPSVL
jgi:hypothetical protein